MSVDAIDTEIMGLQNICRSAKKNDIKQIIFGSSCAVYGDNNGMGPLLEKNSVQPKSHYAALKRMGELLIQTYSTEMNLNYLIARIFKYGRGKMFNVEKVCLSTEVEAIRMKPDLAKLLSSQEQ